MADVPTMRVAVEQAKYLPSAAFAAWCDPPGCQGQYPLRWNPSRVDQPRCCSESAEGGGGTACRAIKTGAPMAERVTFECSAVDPAVCDGALPGGVAPAAVEPAADQAATPRGVVCVYDMGAVAKDAEATDYYIQQQRAERLDPAWYDAGVMATMCAQRADPGRPSSGAWAGCPQDSAYRDGNGRTICSNLVASPLCRVWAAEDARGKVAAKKIAADWCAAHTDAASPTDPAKTDPACIGAPPPPPIPAPMPDPDPDPVPVPEPKPAPPPAPTPTPPNSTLLVGGLCIVAAVALFVAMRRREWWRPWFM
jgi:hypothetical protein